MSMNRRRSAAPAVAAPSTDSGRERILAAAAGLFREHGYAAVSLRAIAAEAGMQGGSLYHHFRGKEEIVGAVLDLGIERVHEAVEAALAATPAAAEVGARMHAAASAHLEALLTHSDFTSANVRIFGQVPPHVREGNKAVRRAYEKLWSDLLNRAAEAGVLRPGLDLRLTRRALIGAMNATLEWYDPAVYTPAALAEAYSGLFLNGILARPVS